MQREKKTLIFKVATQDKEGKTVPLTDTQLLNFRNYVDAMKFAGTDTSVISTDPDLIRYELEVYHDPVVPQALIAERLAASLASFKTEEQFGGLIYRHKLMDAITQANGVVTAKIVNLERRASMEQGYTPIDMCAALYAGYFEYADDCTITYKSSYEL